jgi:transposase-like protein
VGNHKIAKLRATKDPLLSIYSAFPAKALGRANHPTPRVINTDKHAAYPPAIVQLKDEGVLEENCQHRPVRYLNNVLEQDHRAIKRRIRASHISGLSGALGAQLPVTRRFT